MAKYYLAWNAFGTLTSLQTAGKIIGNTGFNFECVEVAAYGAGTVAPADVQHNITIDFLSGATPGTAAGNTILQADQGSAASRLTCGTQYSAEPTTYASTTDLFSFNQRGGMRWGVARGEGLKTQGALTNFSLGARVRSSTSGSIDGNMFWWE